MRNNEMFENRILILYLVRELKKINESPLLLQSSDVRGNRFDIMINSFKKRTLTKKLVYIWDRFGNKDIGFYYDSKTVLDKVMDFLTEQRKRTSFDEKQHTQVTHI